MSSESFALTAPAASTRRLLSRELIRRFALCGAAVALCYCFNWQWLRGLTCSANLWVDQWMGISMQRIASDQVIWRGHTYDYAVACTLADVWCGALPLLWDLGSKALRNIQSIMAFTVGLFGFNVVRLSVSDLLVAHGASWTIGHSLFCGCAYFLIWLWVCRPGTPLERLWPLRINS